MTPLRQRMLDAMVLRGMAQRTQEAYTEAITQLARHYHRSPDALSAQEVQAYLLQLQERYPVRGLDEIEAEAEAMRDYIQQA